MQQQHLVSTRTVRWAVPVLAAGVLAPAAVHAAVFADHVVSYDPGAAAGTSYGDPAAALGAPDDITGEDFGFDVVLNPFNPAFDSDELVQIGAGGHLTLRLPYYVLANPTGPEIGVVENVGLGDDDFPNGTTGSPALTFGTDAGTVEVSADGSTWSSLGPVTFDRPANYYTNAGPFDATAPTSPALADFGKPLDTSLSDFNGKTWSELLDLFDGSGGGTWLDFSITGLDRVGYIRFSLAADAANTLEIDAVSLNSAFVSTEQVPEPGALALIAGAGALLLRRRRPHNLA